MNTAYRVWDGGGRMYYWNDLGMSLEITGDKWILWHSCGDGSMARVVESDDEGAALMRDADQLEANSIYKNIFRKRIYAGDIVQQEETAPGGLYGPEPFIGEVKMIEGQWCIVNEKKEECRPLFSETATNTILGDAFQNPELLEGAE